MTEGTEGWAECTWEGADRRQRRLGLALTPAERLAWLEESLEWIHQVHALNGVAPRARMDRTGGDTLSKVAVDTQSEGLPAESAAAPPCVKELADVAPDGGGA